MYHCNYLSLAYCISNIKYYISLFYIWCTILCICVSSVIPHFKLTEDLLVRGKMKARIDMPIETFKKKEILLHKCKFAKDTPEKQFASDTYAKHSLWGDEIWIASRLLKYEYEEKRQK